MLPETSQDSSDTPTILQESLRTPRIAHDALTSSEISALATEVVITPVKRACTDWSPPSTPTIHLFTASSGYSLSAPLKTVRKCHLFVFVLSNV